MHGSRVFPAFAALFVSVLLLAGCARVEYDDLPVGRFSGTLFVMWVGEGSDVAGDGRFVFVPMPNDPLTFHRDGADATLLEIQPEMMYTDGGSVPRVLQPFKGLSPWGYAPAYMVHDWLFVAKNCVTDQMARPAEAPVADMAFKESVEILGEAIKTLIAERRVQPNDVAPTAISLAVGGPPSRKAWTQEGACGARRISAEHLAEVNNALGRVAGPRVARFDKEALILPQAVPDVETVDGPAASIVSVLRF